MLSISYFISQFGLHTCGLIASCNTHFNKGKGLVTLATFSVCIESAYYVTWSTDCIPSRVNVFDGSMEVRRELCKASLIVRETKTSLPLTKAVMAFFCSMIDASYPSHLTATSTAALISASPVKPGHNYKFTHDCPPVQCD